MKDQNLTKLISVIGLATCLTACTTASSPSPTPVASQPIAQLNSMDTLQDQPPVTTAAERIFEEGLNLYEQGKYKSAIKKFNSPILLKAEPDLRVRTLKYLAFSYCVTNKLRSCHNTFRSALQIDQNFKLLPSEEKHPVWGKVFLEVKSQQPKPPEPPASRTLPALPASQVPSASPAPQHVSPSLPASQVPPPAALPASHTPPAQHTLLQHPLPTAPASTPSAVAQ